MSKRFNGSFKGVDKVSTIEDISSMSNGVFDLKSQYTFSLPPEIIVPWAYGGTLNGYVINSSPGTPTRYLSIDKFSFASETDQANVGTATTQVTDQGTASSDVAGYIIGGDRINSPPYYSSRIDKMPFASEGTSTYVSSLSLFVGAVASAANQDYSFTMGGATYPNPGFPSAAARQTSRIQKMPFASDTDGATTAGYVSYTYASMAGYSTEDYGWAAGGYYQAPPSAYPSPPPSLTNRIQKYPFAATASGYAEDVGDLTAARSRGNSLQSDTHAYYLEDSPPLGEKFPFAVPLTSALISGLDLSGLSPGANCATTSTTTGYLARSADSLHKLNYASDTSIAQIAASPWSYAVGSSPTGFQL